MQDAYFEIGLAFFCLRNKHHTITIDQNVWSNT